MQGLDVLAPRRRRKAAPLSFVKETLLCGLEGRKLSGESALGRRQANVGFCGFLLYVH